MELDLAEVHERWSYLVGHYYESHTHQLLSDLLRPGDSFVDVGANIGHLTLTAARRVGLAGRVLSFEPNPAVCTRLRGHVAKNDLGQIVTVHNIALADRAGSLRLSVPIEGSGGATLGRLGSEYSGGVSSQHEVTVAIGDDLCQDLQSPSVIKVDVEGFEAFVIRGLSRTISRCRPALIVEAWPEHLLNAGASIDDLFGLAAEHGYCVYSIRTEPEAGWRRRKPLTTLRRLGNAGAGLTDDILWLHPSGVHLDRVKHLVEG
jgi:FkbM family methyltransferase